MNRKITKTKTEVPEKPGKKTTVPNNMKVKTKTSIKRVILCPISSKPGRVRKFRRMRGSGRVGSRWSRDSNLETRN